MSEPKTYTSKTPCIVKSFEASTGHITIEDNDRLKRDSKDTAHNPTPIVYEYEYGYIIFADVEADELDNFYSGLKKEGYSTALINLLKLAKQNGCKFLQLDGDGTQYEDLPVYDW